MILRVSAFICLIAICSGGGGSVGGHGGSSAALDGGSNNVIIMQVGKSFQLTCDTSKPDGTTQEVLWYKNSSLVSGNTDRISPFVNGTLIVNESEEDDVGQYTCEPSTGGAAIEKFQVVTLSYSRLPKSTTAIEGDTLILTCDVKGNPEPIIVWSKDNETLVTNEHVGFRTETGLPMNSTLVVNNIGQEDRGLYACTFDNTNRERSFVTETNVRIKDLYAALWPFLGIVLEVVILCLVIFIYEKRRSNVEFEESDTDTGKR